MIEEDREGERERQSERERENSGMEAERERTGADLGQARPGYGDSSERLQLSRNGLDRGRGRSV